MIKMLNRQSHELLVLFFAVVTFAVVILFLAGITSFDCIGDCFPNAVTADGEMHYISDFFSQCKYATGAENAWPWFICAAIIALSVQCKLCLHQMCEVVQIDFEERRERRENNDENDKNDKNDENNENNENDENDIEFEKKKLQLVSDTKVAKMVAGVTFILTSVGIWLVVFYDNISFPPYSANCPVIGYNEAFKTCQKCIDPVDFDPTQWHGVGVVCFTLGIWSQHAVTLWFYFYQVRPTQGGILRRTVYEVCFFAYFFVWFAFLLLFALQHIILSIWFEYFLVLAIFLMNAINLIVLVHLNYRINHATLEMQNAEKKSLLRTNTSRTVNSKLMNYAQRLELVQSF